MSDNGSNGKELALPAEPETPDNDNPAVIAAAEGAEFAKQVDAEREADVKADAARSLDLDAHVTAERQLVAVDDPPPPRCAQMLADARLYMERMVSASLSGQRSQPAVQEALTVTMSTRAWRDTPRVPGLPRHPHSHRRDGAA